jgi:response regulator NasT
VSDAPPRRVLIAEDEALIRLDLKEMLEEEGYAVVGEAGDGEQAIALADSLRPDLVILDVKMPKVDGIAAAERIAGDRIAPVVILTAFGQRDLVERAREAGCDGLPGQAVPEEGPGADDRDGDVPVRRDRRARAGGRRAAGAVGGTQDVERAKAC